MFCTCSRSSTHTPPGRHSSRRLQLVQVTSNLRLVSGWLMKRALGCSLSATTAGMASPFGSLYGGALRDGVADALEFFRFVEKGSRPEALGDLAVRVGGVIGEHHHVELRRARMQLAQHVEATAFGE